MKKLILSLLTIASFTACKKDIVEPVKEQNNVVNRLPKKIIGLGVHKEFLYNADNTLRVMINYYPDAEQYIDSVFYFYTNGKLTRKFTKGTYNYGIYREQTELFTYDNLNRLISTDDGIKKCTFHFNNAGKVDYVLRFNEGILKDSFAVDGGLVVKFLDKGENNSLEYANTIEAHYYFTSNGVYNDFGERKPFDIDSDQYGYVYGKNEIGTVTTSNNDIEFQFELAKEIVQIGESEPTSMGMKDVLYGIHNKSTPYKYCVKHSNFEGEYQFDGNNRLVSIISHNLGYTSTGSQLWSTNTLQIIY